jgi:hypothetical protein
MGCRLLFVDQQTYREGAPTFDPFTLLGNRCGSPPSNAIPHRRARL